MKKFGVVLALLMILATFSVSVAPVKAETLTIFSADFTNDNSLIDTASWTSFDWEKNLTHWYSNALVHGIGGGFGYSSAEKAMYMELNGNGDINNHYRARYAVLKENIVVKDNFTVKMEIYATANKGAAVGVIIYTKSGESYSVMHYGGANWEVGYQYNSEDKMGSIQIVDNDYRFGDLNWTAVSTGFTTVTFSPLNDLKKKGINISPKDIDHINIFIAGMIQGGVKKYVYLKNVEVDITSAYVTFHIKDAASRGLTGVIMKENGSVLNTINDGDTLELGIGPHTITFEKTGYWSLTKTINVQGDMNVSIEMYPSTSSFKLENFPSNITIPENTIYTLTFTLSPIQTSATYNTYLSLSGLDNVISVEKDGSAISPENGKYYLGDISGDTQVSIKFKAGSVGTHGFTLTLTSHDAIMSKTYTTTKTVTYKVEPLPFSVQMPSEWQVGENSLRISESSGQSYLITAVLKDNSGNEVWSDSHAFNPYEAYTFSINVPSEGSYTLELTWNGQTAVYSITVNPAITLKTKTLTVSKGGEGTIVLHFKNPSSDVQYYTIVVIGGFLPAEINQSISVAPLTEKDVSIAFAVPDKLTYDAYELNVQVLQGNATVFSDKVAVSISDSSGFTLFGGESGSASTLIWLLGGLLVLGGLVWALKRRR